MKLHEDGCLNDGELLAVFFINNYTPEMYSCLLNDL